MVSNPTISEGSRAHDIAPHAPPVLQTVKPLAENNLPNVCIQDEITGNQALVKVGGVTSIPRLGFQAHWGVLQQAFHCDNFDIPVWKIGGAYWEQSLQKGLNTLIERGCDWIIAVDYDSMFTSEEVTELLILATRYPEADALIPIQAKRGPINELLVGMKRADDPTKANIVSKETFSGEITPVILGHFGLTLFKVEALKKTAKPWFWAQPNPETGEWDDKKVDADIYFWHKFAEAGNQAYSANRVKIGHLDETVMWVNDDFQIVRQSFHDYYKHGKPNATNGNGRRPPAQEGEVDTHFEQFIKSVQLYNHTSQWGEDALLEAVFQRIGTTNKWCLECGAADGLFFSNTRKLIQEGWTAIQIETDDKFYEKLKERYNANLNVYCIKEFVDLEPGRRLDDVLERVGAPEDMDLMVIDVDGQDYHLWNSVVNFRPRVVMIEFEPKSEKRFIPEPGGRGQAGLMACQYLARAKGYTAICRTPGNLICVINELAPLLANKE